jgi:murein DD-endopeptidase MepM/ murein hydrolase activator NlpD
MRRWVMVSVVAVGLVAGAWGGGGRAAACWSPPVTAPMVEGFDPPECPWCAGHRGLEFAPTSGQVVRSVAAGTVAFAGSVAGRRYVAVEQAGGLRVTYGWLRSIAVSAGDPVATGDRIGVAGERFMFTIRSGGTYVDPAPLVGRTVRRPWLVPRSGPARRPPPARLVCGP